MTFVSRSREYHFCVTFKLLYRIITDRVSESNRKCCLIFECFMHTLVAARGNKMLRTLVNDSNTR